MTDKVNPSINRPAEAFKTAGAIAYGGHGEGGFIVDGSDPTEIAVQDAGINEGDLNTFQQTSSDTSLDVTIDPGESFIFGSWVCIDVPVTVTLVASTANQTVYVGWNKNGTDDVIIGKQSAFESASGNTDKKIELWTFDTDANGVTAVTDNRSIGYQSSSQNIKSDGTIEFEANDGSVAFEIVPSGGVNFNSVNDLSGNTMLSGVVATGTVTLSDGVATVDTTIDSTDSDATFMLALGLDDSNVEVAGGLHRDGSGNYQVRIRETDTDTGNPTVDYDVVRVR